MKNLLSSFAAFALLSVAALAAEMPKHSDSNMAACGTASACSAGSTVNVSGASNTAVSGYDVVAFFTDAKAVNGSPFITAEHGGATYFFASEEHKALFAAAPEKYVPQYGGFCAFGVGAVNKLLPVDISTWQVRGGKLYLNLNQAILSKFNADFAGLNAKADQNWPALAEKYGK